MLVKHLPADNVSVTRKKRKSILQIINQFLCPHTVWDCDNKVRIIECCNCGKIAAIKKYRDLFDEEKPE